MFTGFFGTVGAGILDLFLGLSAMDLSSTGGHSQVAKNFEITSVWGQRNLGNFTKVHTALFSS